MAPMPAEAYQEAVQRAWTLARHGTGEHWAQDAISDARQRMMEAGETPPIGCIGLASDMDRRIRQAAEAGETLSEAEAVERLIAEGPPPLAPAQQRLSKLIRTIGDLNADQEERLLATARELAEEPQAA